MSQERLSVIGTAAFQKALAETAYAFCAGVFFAIVIQIKYPKCPFDDIGSVPTNESGLSLNASLRAISRVMLPGVRLLRSSCPRNCPQR